MELLLVDSKPMGDCEDPLGWEDLRGDVDGFAPKAAQGDAASAFGFAEGAGDDVFLFFDADFFDGGFAAFGVVEEFGFHWVGTDGEYVGIGVFHFEGAGEAEDVGFARCVDGEVRLGGECGDGSEEETDASAVRDEGGGEVGEGCDVEFDHGFGGFGFVTEVTDAPKSGCEDEVAEFGTSIDFTEDFLENGFALGFITEVDGDGFSGRV